MNIINFVILLTITILGFITTIQGTLLYSYSNLVKFPLDKIGIIFTAMTCGFFLFSISSGIISQYFKKKKIISIIVLIYTITLLLFPFSNNIYNLILKMFLLGGGTGSLLSFFSAYLVSLNKKHSSYFLSLIHIFFSLGGVLGPIVINMMVKYKINLFYIYIYMGVLSFFILIFLIIYLPSENIKVSRLTLNDFKTFIKNPSLKLLCLSIALYNGAEVGIWGWLSTISAAKNHSIFYSNYLISIFWFGMLLGRLFLSTFIKRYKIILLLNFYFVFTIILSLVTLFINTDLKIIIIFFIGFGYSTLCPLMISYGFEINKQKDLEYTLSSLLLSSGSIGIMIIPYFMGNLIQFNSVQLIPAVSLIIALISIKVIKTS